MAGIYLHIPFCKQACHYCDFHFSTNTSLMREMVRAIGSELILQRSYLDQQVDTIYFGGGTPSLLAAEEIKYLLDTIAANYRMDADPEITLEANPDDLDKERVFSLKAIGINRLSIGIQSFDNNVLQRLNRAHTGQVAMESFRNAREAGFDNITIDLIYAIPGQDDALWLANIQQGLMLEPEHISAYSLTIEEKTAFGNWAAKGKLKPVDEDASATQLESLVTILEQHGYEQYEVSNFARPGFYSRHNSNYWKQQPYLGVGPSAHSYNLHSRQWNVRNNHEYLRKLNEQVVPASVELLTKEDKVNDYLLTTLRTSWGADLAKMEQEFGYNPVTMHRLYVEQLISENLVTINNDKLMLTPRGRFVADKIASDLFLMI